MVRMKGVLCFELKTFCLLLEFALKNTHPACSMLED